MPRKRYTVEQILTKLREAEVELAQGVRSVRSRKTLKTMEPMSGLEPPYGLRITNGDEQDHRNDCKEDS
jgi:hypothetical protein